MAIVTFYDAGNMLATRSVTGALTEATSTEITVSDGNYAAIYNGSFSYSGTQVFGVMQSYREYAGSLLEVSITGLNVDANSASASINSGQLQPFLSAALSGNDTIVGSGFGDTLAGFGGNDVIIPNGGRNVIDGGAGFDTVVIHASITTASSNVSNGVLYLSTAENSNQITNVERVQFSDGILALDTQGDAGNAYRLYQAAFNRHPDTGGLSYWTHQLDVGTDILAVAQGFVSSAEFRTVYGSNPTSGQIVDLFYHNVLGRAGEQGGFDYWVGLLNRGVPVATVLEGFADSNENHGYVDPTLVQGIVLDRSAFLV